MAYETDFKTIDDGRNDLTFMFGEDELVHVTQEEVQNLEIDPRVAFKMFALFVNNMQKSAGFKKLLIKSDTLHRLLGKQKIKSFDTTIETMLNTEGDSGNN